MASLIKLLLLLLCTSVVVSSKLKLPRVLLPLLKFSSTNFTVELSGSGCFKWSLSRLDIIQIIPLNQNKQLDCSSQVKLSTITKELIRNTVVVLLEEVSTKETFRFDVLVDAIHSLNIVTHSRQLFVEESPEIFEVRAYDDQGNEFTTLEGIQFSWTISSGGRSDVSGKSNPIRFINFKDSPYQIPESIYNLDIQGLTGHLALLEGVKTGTANVSVELSQYEYRHVPPAVVQLNVIANLIIEPSDSYILPGDVIYYKLFQMKNGRFVEVPLPSTQYSLIIEDDSVVRQIKPWAVEALVVGQTKLILSDINSKMSDAEAATYLPSVNLNVVSPGFMNLVLLPHKNWITTTYHPNAIVAEVYDSENHKIYLGPYAVVKIDFDSGFKAVEKTHNGSYVNGYAITVGTIHVTGELSNVRSNDNVLIPLNRVTAEADILVHPELVISPSQIVLPWDPVESSNSYYQLNVSGGDGFYQWSTADEQVAIVTQSGVVKPRSVGDTEVFVAIQKNPALQRSARITITPPVELKIVYSSVEAELGSPVYLAVALYYKAGRKTALFTDCSQFPFSVDVNSQDFVRDISAPRKAPENACATVAIIGNRAGTATVTVSYVADSTLLQDSTIVSVYQPLRVIAPETGKTVLAVGARRHVVIAGGPFPSAGNGHTLTIDYEKSFVTLERIDEQVDGDRVFEVTCRAISQSRILFKVVGKPYVGMNEALSMHEVHVVCARPVNIRLEVADAIGPGCPLSFRERHVVLNNRAIVVKTVVLDEASHVFDNATSLEMKWTVSNEELVRVHFQNMLKLHSDDKGHYQVPMYHYQTLAPNSKVGTVELTAAVLGYHKHWLKKLRISGDSNDLKLSTEQLHDTIALTLVNSVHVSSNFLSIFNHPKNVAKLYITSGSGFYKVSPAESDVAQVRYVEKSRSVDIVPVLPGTISLTVKDECLDSDPLRVNVFVLTVTRIDVDLIDKIEKGKSTRALLKLFDSDGNVVTEKSMLNLKSEVDVTDVVKVDCSEAVETADRRITCTVTGVELGLANLVFRAGFENSVVRSAPIRVQVYPPLQIVPQNVTLVPGAVMQLTVKGGPQLDCVIEYSTNSDVIVVDGVGNVAGNEVGDCVVVARAVGVRVNGEKIVYSEDTAHVNVVYLEGIRIGVPLIKIKTGAKIPIWVEGIPEQVGPLVLAAVHAPMLYKWDVSSPNLANVYNIMEETGIKVADSDKVSMRLRTLKSGRLVVTVTVVAPANVVKFGHKGVFKDSVSVEIFDELKIANDLSQPMLFAPNMKYRMKSNKDRVARITYKSATEEYSTSALFDVDRKGLLVTHSKYGIGHVDVTSIEDNDFVQVRRIPIKIARVQYMMLNIVPELQVGADSFVSGLPKGAKLQFYVSYYDNEGNEFTGTNAIIKFKLNKADKLRITQSENDQNLILDLLDTGTTAIKVYDHDSTITPDIVRLNVLAYVQPDRMKFIVGDAICFTAPKISIDSHECSWNSSNDNSLAIDKKTGLGVAKSKQSNIVISYQCTNNLQIVTTADVFSLQKIEIIASGISNISNNGKRYIIPLSLRNDVEDPLMWRTSDLPWEKGCMKNENTFFYPYECSIRISPEGSVDNSESLFSIYPKFDLKSGHSCVIESAEGTISISSPIELNVIVKVSWNRYESTSITIPFKPAINVLNKKLSISDQDPVSILRVSGSPAILNQIQVLPSNSKYIAIVDEMSDIKSVTKYSVYLKPAYLKETLDASQKLSLWVYSEETDQNITVPIETNVNVDHYVSPHHITDQITYYLNEYAFIIVVTLVLCFVIVYAVSRLLASIYGKSFADTSFANLSHDRSHFSSPGLPSPTLHPYKNPSFSEIQMIYGKSTDKMHRSRRN